MYNQVWKKYLPIINIQLKRASSEDRVTDLNRMDFERAGIGRKTGYKFTIQLTNGRVSNVISGSPLAMNLASVLLEDENSKKIMKDHEGKIRFVARYMPLHPNSINAANFTEAAGEQGKFWQARELLFQKQPEWGERHGPPSMAPKPDVKALFDKYARELGLDPDKVSLAIKENRFAAKIERDKKDGQSLGVRKTPQFFVNGRELARFGEGDLRALIEEELKK